MKVSYRIEMINELVNMIQKENLRVFVAERGTYGFYTNNEGTRLVGFQVNPILSFSGKYKSKNNGTGWQITNNLPNCFTDLLKTNSPFECDHYMTLDEYLNIHQKSSKYKEVTK